MDEISGNFATSALVMGDGDDDKRRIDQGDNVRGDCIATFPDPAHLGAKEAKELATLKAMARYAENAACHYRRMEAMARMGDNFRVLNLKVAATRTAILTATSMLALFQSDHAEELPD